MGFTYKQASGDVLDTANSIAPCVIGPVPDSDTVLKLVQGSTWRWKISILGGDVDNVASFEPATNEVVMNEPGCYTVGEFIKIFCHENQCSEWLLNGEHEITAIDASGSRLTIGTAMKFTDAQSFEALPTVPLCTTSTVVPARISKTVNITNVFYSGCITSRLPAQGVRLAMGANTTQSSRIIRLSEMGQVVPGDLVTVPDADITDAMVIRIWQENGADFLEVDQTANRTGCFSLNTEVGTLAKLNFTTPANVLDGTVTAFLTSAQTAGIPLLGEPIAAYRNVANGRRTTREQCGTYYNVGIYSIFAKYVDTDLNVESELIARGCVHLYPTNSNKLSFV